MSGYAGYNRRPLVVGTNHRTSSLGLRDRLFIDDDAARPFLIKLSSYGIEEAMVLSTCDRVEVQAVHEDEAIASQIILDRLSAYCGLSTEELRKQTYTLNNELAVDHVFRVASALDSLVIGESHVLGQVKAAFRLAHDVNMVGPELDSLIQAAFSVAKRVLSETAVGEGPVSIAAVAVQLSEDLLGDLKQHTALLIGSGEMGQLVGKYLLAAGLKKVVITHPRPERAEFIVANSNFVHVPFERFLEQLVEADIVISSLGHRNPLLAADMVHGALRKRRWKPILVVDLGVPGDVEPAVNRINDVFLYDIEDLENLASESHSKRQAEAEAGRRIVADEVMAYIKSRQIREAVPMLVEYRDWGEKLRDQVLKVSGGDAEKATHLLLRRLMHYPTEALKAAAKENVTELAALESALRQLFPTKNEDTNESNRT